MSNTDDLIMRGKMLLKDGKFEDALSCFEQAVLLESQNVEAWNQKGAALRSLGRYDEAIECFNRSLALDPKDKFAS